MTQPSWAPASIDLDRPSVSRVYDYYLGGFHNFAPDRELAEQVIAMEPLVPMGAKANRAFLQRAVGHLVELGVRQFLDIGSGIPTVGNMHQIAQHLAPDARVVYIDIDPVAVVHSQAILYDDPNATAMIGDLLAPEDLLTAVAETGLLDLNQPTALLALAVLHFVDDDDAAHSALRTYREALGPGSYLAVSHSTQELRPAVLTDGVMDIYQRATAPFTLRTREQIRSLVSGYDLLDPGLVLVEEWRPGAVADVENPERFPVWAGIGRAQ